MPDPRLNQAALETTFLRRMLSASDAAAALQVAVDYVVDALGCDVSWTGLIDGERIVMGAHRGVQSGEMASVWETESRRRNRRARCL